MRIFIIGHKSPDLDTVASAVTYAEFLEKIKRYEGVELIPVLPGEPDKETEYVFAKFSIEMPKPIEEYELREDDAVILVDHNERSQRHEMIPNEKIVEIVDHHNICIDLCVDFGTPIRVDIKPYGATATVIYDQFKTCDLEVSERTLKLTLAAIISDTQSFNSSTTTGADKNYAKEIASVLKIDIDEMSRETSNIKYDTSGFTPEEIVAKDQKIFELNGKKLLIAQVETVTPGSILEQKQELIEALKKIKLQLEADQAYLVVKDMIKKNSQIIYTTEEEKSIVEKAFNTEGSENTADIGQKVSRKKDILPAIKNAQK